MNREERKELLLAIEENQLLDDLMDHPGMKMLMAKAQALYDKYNRLSDVTTTEILHHRRGQLDILSWILTFQDITKQTLVSLVETAEKETARLQGQTDSLIDLDENNTY